MTQQTNSLPIPADDVQSIVNREIAKWNTQKEFLAASSMNGEEAYQVYALILDGYKSLPHEDLTIQIRYRAKTVDELCSFYFDHFGKDGSEMESGWEKKVIEKFDRYIEHLETLPIDPRIASMIETAKRERNFLK